MTLTQEELRRRFDYNPETGVFTALVTTGPRCRAGQVVGSDDLHGYLTARINKKSYKLHRLAFLWMTGRMPDGDVDHINGQRSDNRWANLRDVCRAHNLQNQRTLTGRRSATGLMGAYPSKGGRFEARISINNRSKVVGRFDSAEEAHLAYLNAKRQLHPGCTV